MRVFGLLITKDDHEAFGDWCREQLRFYERVVCLDGSDNDQTSRQAGEYRDRIIYLHERDFDIPRKTDHGLRRIAHLELIDRFGLNIWVMCCHTDEFCYHDPRKVAARAEMEGYDLVSWYSPHFYPHPSELVDISARLKRPVQERFCHYHWGYLGRNIPWIEDRLYKASPEVAWDAVTHGSVRPHGLRRPAPFHPIYRHFKVCSIDLDALELDHNATRYRAHWQHQEHRTGLPFRVEKVEDLFVSSVPKYSFCTRFDGVFEQPWNIGEEYRPDATITAERASLNLGRWNSSVELKNSPIVSSARPVVAIGPRMPGFGSWEWVGADLADELSKEFNVRIFDREIPPCNVIVLVKFKPATNVLRQLSQSASVIYCPIDNYGSVREIDADATALSACDRVLIHCERLRKFIAPYARVEYIDHHVKFTAPFRTTYGEEGPLLWVGVRTNLPPLVEWVNSRSLPAELWVLTNPEDTDGALDPRSFGFQPHNVVRIDRWSAARQRDWTAECRGAFDIKENNFRALHKPPAKGIDFIASGVPLALEPASSTAEHLARLGFEVARVDDWERWLSPEYAQETAAFGAAMRELLSLARVGRRWRRIIHEVLSSREIPKMTNRGEPTACSSLSDGFPHASPLRESRVELGADDAKDFDPTTGAHREMKPLNLSGGKMDIPVWVRGAVDRAILRDLWDRDEYGVRLLAGPQPQSVVDIGAHIGGFVLLARKLWPTARVVACEADPDNAQVLRMNIWGDANVDAVEAAIVADDISEIEFHAVRDKASSNSGGGSCERPEAGSTRMRVPAISLQRLWRERDLVGCDLLKLDCEGSELALLRALSATRRLAGIRYIVGEWHAADASQQSTSQIRAEIERILMNTHRVRFGPWRGGREGLFSAHRIHSK
jgi:FkbM family methyltransferase